MLARSAESWRNWEVEVHKGNPNRNSKLLIKVTHFLKRFKIFLLRVESVDHRLDDSWPDHM